MIQVGETVAGAFFDGSAIRRRVFASSVLALCAAFSVAGSTQADVLTQRSDIGRTGVTADSQISPSSFDGTWIKLRELPVDGVIYAQPLYVSNVVINNVSRNVVYVATAVNRVYAFDADTGSPIWDTGTNLPGPDTTLNQYAGTSGPEQACAFVTPSRLVGAGSPSYAVGISSTPVIDKTAGFLYLTYRTINLGIPLERVAKLSLATGAITWQSITSSFDATKNQGLKGLRQRTSLLLDQGMIYAGFAMNCEGSTMADFKYRGTILAIDQNSLTVKGKFDPLPFTDPNDPNLQLLGGGVWQAGTGIAADSQHRIYFTTGNPDVDQSAALSQGPPIYANAFVSLLPAIDAFRNVTFTFADYFTPWRANWMGAIDLDLGAAGVVIPPNLPEVVGGGKEGIVYVLNRGNLGGKSPNAWGGQSSAHPIPFCAWGTPAPCIGDPHQPWPAQCDTSSNPPFSAYPDSAQAENVTQKFIAAKNMDCTPPMNNWGPWPHIHGTPAFATIGTKQYLYVWPEKGQLRAYLRDPTTSPPYQGSSPKFAGATSANDPGMPGGMLTVAVNNGNGVLFAALPIEAYGSGPGMAQRGALVAFDAAPAPDGTLKQLWGDYQQVYWHAKWVPPTVANGNVFLATGSNKVIVYGKNSGTTPVASHRTNLAAILHNPGTNSITAAFVRPDGRIQIYGEASGGNWTSYAIVGGNNEFPPGAPLVLAKQGTQLNVMGIAGADHKLHVYTTTATQAPTSWSTTAIVVTGATTFPSGAPLAFQYRTSPSELDVFVVDDNHKIELLKVPNTAGSTSWTAQAITGTTCTFPTVAALAADTRVDGATTFLDVFGVSSAGKLCAFSSGIGSTTSFNSGVELSSSALFLPGAHIASAHQGSGATDALNVFLVGGAATNKEVDPNDNMNDATDYHTTIFSAGSTTNTKVGSLIRVTYSQASHSWTFKAIKRRLTPLGLAPAGHPPGVPGGDITAIKQYPDQLDVLFTSELGQVQLYASTESAPDTWNRFDLPPFGMPGASLVAVPKGIASNGFANDIELLVPAPEHIYHSEVVGSGSWSSPSNAL